MMNYVLICLCLCLGSGFIYYRRATRSYARMIGEFYQPFSDVGRMITRRLMLKDVVVIRRIRQACLDGKPLTVESLHANLQGYTNEVDACLARLRELSFLLDGAELRLNEDGVHLFTVLMFWYGSRTDMDLLTSRNTEIWR